MPRPVLPGLDDDEQRCWQLFLDSSMRMLATVNGTLMVTHRLTLFDPMLVLVGSVFGLR